MSTPVAFTKFGQLFLETLLSEHLIEAQVGAAIPARTPIDEPMKAWGNADLLSIGPVRRSIGVDQIAFEIPVVLTMNLATPVGHLPPVDARLVLDLAFTFHANLVIAGAITLRGDNIDMKFDSWNPIDPLIVAVLKGQMVEKIKASLTDAAPGLIIDLEAILLEQAYGGDVFKQPGDQDSNSVEWGRMADQVLPRDAIAKATMPPGRKMDAQLFLRAGERIRLKIYGQVDGVPGLGFTGIALEASLGSGRRGADDTISNNISFYDIWDPVWSRMDLPDSDNRGEAWFTASVGGTYKLTIEAAGTNGARTNVRVIQERRFSPTMAHPETRITFAQFGVNLFTIGLSSAFFLRQFEVKLLESAKDGVVTVPWKDGPLGDVVFLIAPRIEKVEDAASSKPDFEALRRVSLSALLKCMRGNERLFQVPLEVDLILAVSGSDAPSIDVSLKEIGKIGFDMKGFTAIDEGTERLVKGILEGSVGDFAGKTLRDLANKAVAGLVVQSQKISDIVEAKIKAAKPAGIGPKPVGSGLDTGPKILEPGVCTAYVLPLKEKETAEIHLEMRTERTPGNIGAYAWLSVCDENFGVLEDENHVFNPRSRAAWTNVLRYRAPADGNFKVAVRSKSLDSENWEKMTYQLRIKMVT
jgi:hypothetical protein